jgi:alkyldihydroxyacetonephosphate synthase
MKKTNGLWGYKDVEFTKIDDHIVLKGGSYSNSDKKLFDLLPFMEKELNVKLVYNPKSPSYSSINIENNLPIEFLNRITIEYTVDFNTRCLHSHGQGMDEIYNIMNQIQQEHVVDIVFYPKNENEIMTVAKIAKEFDMKLMAYGGGTNVSKMLQNFGKCTFTGAVNMVKYFNGVISIDHENGIANVQAGINGVDLEKKLSESGCTTGHLPDSYEFSTLGGWIATNASGMKKNKYGNIEDIVLNVRYFSFDECKFIEMSQPHERTSLSNLDVRRTILGSEGKTGIITSAHVKIKALPCKIDYEAILFKDFETGFDFMKRIHVVHGIRPACIRLVDNVQFRFGRACKEKDPQSITKRLTELYITKWRGYDPHSMVMCTIVDDQSTYGENNILNRIRNVAANEFDCIVAGATHGKTGFDLTFGIAYIRDLALRCNIIAESFETFVPWSKVHMLIAAVESELRSQYKQRFGDETHKPFLSYRISQSYDTGCCIYFYLAMYAGTVAKPNDVYSKIEHQLRHAILDNGGSLSHHHGIGIIRRDFISRIFK